MNDLTILKKLLNKRSEDEVVEEAVNFFVDHGIPTHIRDVYRKFLEISEGNRQSPGTPTGTMPVGVYRVVPEAKAMRFGETKTRGRIMLELMRREQFTRADFRAVVASVMGWDEQSKKFAIRTKFRSLDEAERAWWGTLKSRDKLIR